MRTWWNHHWRVVHYDTILLIMSRNLYLELILDDSPILVMLLFIPLVKCNKLAKKINIQSWNKKLVKKVLMTSSIALEIWKYTSPIYCITKIPNHISKSFPNATNFYILHAYWHFFILFVWSVKNYYYYYYFET